MRERVGWVFVRGTEVVSTIADQRGSQIRDYYLTLYRAWGRQHWWPGRSRFEVIVGAVLVQNTAWRNVEHALHALRSAKALSLPGMRAATMRELEPMIRPAGYLRQKARTLKGFIAFVDERHSGSLSRMFFRPTEELRRSLLSIRGIGPETADSILLYAGQKPVFVVDAYARRVLDRHKILGANVRYDEIRDSVERALAPLAEKHPDDAGETSTPSHRPSAMSLAKRSPLAQVHNEMHGLMVAVGKKYCLKSAPRCEECPLQKFLPLH